MNKTKYPQTNPQPEDKFERWQIIAYLEEDVPLGYYTERDHIITERLINRIIRHFSELSTDYKPSND